MRRARLIALFVIALVAILGTVLLLAPGGRRPAPLAAEDCDASLWDHVYQPERLKVIERCTSAVGRVDEIREESDGDVHILLDLEDRSVLNLFNRLRVRGDLVVESICEIPPTRTQAAAACAGFKSKVAIPNVGDRVRVTGAFVIDTHNGWDEIHPVTRIELLGP